MEGDFYVSYGRLDDYQRTIIENLFYSNEVVAGKAGTGKSLIALHKLARVPQGKRASLVVFTKSLKRYFEDGMRELGIEDHVVQYEQEWDKQPVDYLFVDECQDFSPERIDEFIGKGGKCFFFGDSEQTIMNFADRVTQSVETTAHKLGVSIHYLFTNYRLTKENAALAERVGNVRDLVRHCVRQGVKPQLILGATPQAQLDAIMDIIKTNNLTRVGILLPYNSLRGPVDEVVGLHEHEAAVGVPAVRGDHVRGDHVEPAVLGTEDVRIADAAGARERLRVQHGPVVVEREEMASVLADGEPDLLLLRIVAVEVGEEIAGAVLRGGYGVGLLRGGREGDADGAERGEGEFAEEGGSSGEGGTDRHGRSPDGKMACLRRILLVAWFDRAFCIIYISFKRKSRRRNGFCRKKPK